MALAERPVRRLERLENSLSVRVHAGLGRQNSRTYREPHFLFSRTFQNDIKFYKNNNNNNNNKK